MAKVSRHETTTYDLEIDDESYSSAILFADVAGFTPMSAEMTPTELVSLLNEVFSEFDALVDAKGLEKIKTIGDAYMVASGVPTQRDDHPQPTQPATRRYRDAGGWE